MFYDPATAEKTMPLFKIKYTNNTYNAHKNDSKSMWQLINSSIGRKTKKGLDIPNYFEDNNIIYNNFKEIAEGFNKFFTGIGEKLQAKLPACKNSIFDYLGTKKQSKFNFFLLMPLKYWRSVKN